MIELSDLPLQTLEIVIDGRPWKMRVATDHDALLTATAASATFPFGLLLWESAIGLGEALCRAPALVAERTVLELGCGAGLSGLVAHALGGDVTQTDHADEALGLAKINAAANGIADVTRFRSDWLEWDHDRRYDTIIGADILYDRDLHTPIIAIMARNIGPGGCAVFADPARPDTLRFVDRLAAAGWTVTRSEARAPRIGVWGPESQTVAVDIYVARRV